MTSKTGITKSRLFIIGNGVDLANGLPTDYRNDFRRIATRKETFKDFWRHYSDVEDDIWSNFEEALGCPNLDVLWDKYFQPYSPDYLSDRESDRNGMLWVAEVIGKLHESLLEFAEKAEAAITTIKSPVPLPGLPIQDSDLVINFNYTSTLEKKYHVLPQQIYYVHGKVNDSNLIIGFNREHYKASDVYYEVKPGRGSWTTWDLYAEPQKFNKDAERFDEHEDGDYYIDTAHKMFEERIRSFEKKHRLEIIDDLPVEVDDIIVIGHSMGLSDQPYFQRLVAKYPDSNWKVSWHNELEVEGINNRLTTYGIKRHQLFKF